MQSEEQAQRRFLEALAQTDFAVRYYGLFETFRSRQSVAGKSDVDVKQVVGKISMPIAYETRESVYTYHSTADLKFVTRSSVVEFTFAYDMPQGAIGGPFALLASGAALLKDPAFTYSPLTPAIPFASAEDLRSILDQGFMLFDIAKGAVRLCFDAQ